MKWVNIRGLKQLLQSERGSVIPLVAVGIFMLVGATGAAIDMGRVEIVKTRMQNALDAAGLAVGSEVNTANIPIETQKYFTANFPTNYLGTTITSAPAATTNADNSLITLNVAGKVNMSFMQILGINYVNVSAHSQIRRTSRGLELVLVLDTTGSMAQSAGGSVTKLQAAQSASVSLLNILYGDHNTSPNLWVGLVPFSQAVNIGTANTSWLDASTTFDFGPIANTVTKKCTAYNGTTGTYSTGPKCAYTLSPLNTKPGFGTLNWQGCVESRSNGAASPQYDLTDDTPSVKPFKPYWYPVGTSSGANQNTWLSSGNTNCTGGGCLKSHTVTSTCVTSYPACCAANAESCTNPPNCGKAPTTASCQKTICDVQGPPQVCTSTKTTYDYSASTWMGVNKGPNAYCPKPIQPMVAEKDTLVSAINNLQAVGETEIPLGLAWAWRMLSPNWRGLWGGEMDANQLPLAYHTPLMTKAVILMTDGDNNIIYKDYSAYGLTTNNTNNQLGVVECTTGGDCAVGITALNTRTSTVCTNMKAQGIVIYTIALGTAFSANSQTMLQNCASNPAFFFLSPSTSDLESVFQRIADSLANLNISQ